jgi:putative tryptophan/tyrosine transport system substrate-binding protein
MGFNPLKRREFITLLGGAATIWPLTTRAQQPAIPMIGFLGSISPAAVARPLATFRQVLKETGFEEGKTVAIEYRWAEGQYDRLPDLATDLVRRQVAVIVTVGGDPPALASKAATSTIPIVFMVGRNPVKFGLVASLNRPGGNATGVNLYITETEAKRIGLLRDLLPTATTLAVLINPKTADAEIQLSEVLAAARALQQQIEVMNASSELDINAAFVTLAQRKIGALLVGADPFFNSRRDLIISLAARHAVPAIYPLRDFAVSGGLISYGTSLMDAYRQVGIYAGRILKGEKPGELPVVQPTNFEFVINLKTAKALGLQIPDKILAIADEVIE